MCLLVGCSVLINCVPVYKRERTESLNSLDFEPKSIERVEELASANQYLIS